MVMQGIQSMHAEHKTYTAKKALVIPCNVVQLCIHKCVIFFDERELLTMHLNSSSCGDTTIAESDVPEHKNINVKRCAVFTR